MGDDSIRLDVLDIGDRSCGLVQQKLAAFGAGALPLAEHQAVQGHLEGCSDCLEALAQESEVSEELRRIVGAEKAPAPLRTAIQGLLRRESRRKLGVRLALAAAVVVALGWQASLHFTGVSPYRFIEREFYISSLLKQVAPLLGVGLGDHLHCAYFRTFPEQPPTDAKTLEELGEDWAPLADLVQAHSPADFEVRLAHRCNYRGREFVHIAMLSSGAPISLLLTESRSGEAFQPVTADDLPAAVVDEFVVAGFDAAPFLGFVVSSLEPARNAAVASRLRPPVVEFVARVTAS